MTMVKMSIEPNEVGFNPTSLTGGLKYLRVSNDGMFPSN